MLNLLRLIGKTPKFRNSSLTSRSPGLHSDPPLLSLVKTPGHVVLSLIGQFLLLLVPQRTPPTIRIRICRLCKLHPHLQSNLNIHLLPHRNIPLQKPLVLPHRKTLLVDLLVCRNPRKGNSKGMLKRENAHRRLAAKLWSHTARPSSHTPVPLFTPPLLTMSPPTRLPTSPELSKRPWHRLFAKEWTAAILQEIGSLDKHGTYSIVPRPHGRRVVGSRFAFKIKDGETLDPRFKARFVARGFTQVHHVDYEDTFAPVV